MKVCKPFQAFVSPARTGAGWDRGVWGGGVCGVGKFTGQHPSAVTFGMKHEWKRIRTWVRPFTGGQAPQHQAKRANTPKPLSSLNWMCLMSHRLRRRRHWQRSRSLETWKEKGAYTGTSCPFRQTVICPPKTLMKKKTKES